MNHQESLAAWQADRPHLAARGVILPGCLSYVPDGWGHNLALAMDAQPSLQTDPNSAVPAILTTLIDPEVFRILFAPTEAATIFGEQKKGTWVDDTVMFPVVEHTGEVSSYGDYAENGRAGVNTNWPQRQQYLYQTIKEYGEREMERAGLARISWVSEIDQAAATVMNQFENYTYFFGVQNLQNYGLLNDPNLSAAIAPATKAAGNGNVWMYNGAINATANEVYQDIQNLFAKLVMQTAGRVKAKDKLVLAMSPLSEVALTATNSFNVNVFDLLKKNFPNIRFETAVQYGVLSATNPQGIAAGNLVQLFAETVGGQKTGYCAFSEKMRAHPIIRAMSSFRQKVSAGTWGAILRMPIAVAQLLGV